MAESNDNVNEQPDERGAADDERGEAAAEDVVGGQETPPDDALSRVQAIVQEPVAESEQILAEQPSLAGASATEEDLEYIEETPREKPAIPGMDLEVDIVREGDEGLGGRPRYSEDEPYVEEEEGEQLEEELPATIADASIDLA